MKTKTTKTKSKAKTKSSSNGDREAVLREALRAKDGGAALSAALEWWHDVRSPKLADLVEAISTRVSEAPIEDSREWTTVAAHKDPLDLGRLLPKVTSLPVSFLPGAADMLASFPDDPRLAKAVATWAIDPPTTSSSTYPFWTKLLERTAAIGDVRAVPLIKKRLAKPPEKSQFWPKFYAALERVVTKLKAVTAPSCDEAALKKLASGIDRLTPISQSDKPTRAAAKGQHVAARTRHEEVPKVDGTPLVQAATHLAAGRVAPAIDAMLVRWRETRVPAIADAIDRASRLLPSWGKPLGTTAKEVHEAWMTARADDALGAMPQLLRNVNVGGGAMAERHLLELTSLPDDPRISLRLAEVAAQYGMSPERTQYWKSLFEILARGRDVRVCQALRDAFNDFTGTYYNHHRQGRKIIGAFTLDPAATFPSAWPLVLSDADRKDLGKVEANLTKLEAKMDRTEHRLLDAIVENWKDDAPRLVYADWLSDRGHPRGELIVLECKSASGSTLTVGETKRKKELAKTPFIHGALADVGEPIDMDRGVVKKLQVRYGIGMLSWRAVVGEPLLALIDTIGLPHGTDVDGLEDLARLFVHPESRHLKRVENIQKAQAATLEELTKTQFQLEKRALVRKE